MRRFRSYLMALGILLLLGLQGPVLARMPFSKANYPVVGTGQDQCYGLTGAIISCPPEGAALSGQDAQNPGHKPSYQDLGAGTVADLITGLEWAKAPSEPLTFAEAAAYARASRLGGHDDWRVPTIRELYSLIDYRGTYRGDPKTSRPYLETSVFDFAYAEGVGLGDAAEGRRPIDVQEWSSTRYIGKTMGRDETVFGVNFADGRIKGYPVMDPANRMQTPHRLAVRLVRGKSYGLNDFTAKPEIIHDRATQLMWQRKDDGKTRSWSDALAYCQGLSLAGYGDWHLPNAKELHSIVDYARIPAIDPLFSLSDPKAYLWSSTTHLEGPPPAGESGRAFQQAGELAIYAAIGPALGFMEAPPGSGHKQWMDVHGAGAMRSDPKTAVSGQFKQGFGPQGDDIRGQHLVLCVRQSP